jgi:hypothetical protein
MMKAVLRRRPTPALIVSLMALVLAMGGFAVAAIPDGSGVFHACYKKKKGTLRLVSSSSKCKKSERSVSWNQKGANGANGAAGAKGDKGDKGDAGTPATKLWAVVDGSTSPTLARSSGAISVNRLAAGQYRVVFNQEISACAFVTSGDGNGVGGVPEDIYGSTHVSSAGNDTVFIILRDNTGAQVDGDITLAVFC